MVAVTAAFEALVQLQRGLCQEFLLTCYLSQIGHRKLKMVYSIEYKHKRTPFRMFHRSSSSTPTASVRFTLSMMKSYNLYITWLVLLYSKHAFEIMNKCAWARTSTNVRKVILIIPWCWRNVLFHTHNAPCNAMPYDAMRCGVSVFVWFCGIIIIIIIRNNFVFDECPRANRCS